MQDAVQAMAERIRQSQRKSAELHQQFREARERIDRRDFAWHAVTHYDREQFHAETGKDPDHNICGSAAPPRAYYDQWAARLQSLLKVLVADGWFPQLCGIRYSSLINDEGLVALDILNQARTAKGDVARALQELGINGPNEAEEARRVDHWLRWDLHELLRGGSDLGTLNRPPATEQAVSAEESPAESLNRSVERLKTGFEHQGELIERLAGLYSAGDGDLAIVAGGFTLWGGPMYRLQPRQLKLLEEFQKNRGAFVLRSRLDDKFWGDNPVTPGAVTKQVNLLGKELNRALKKAGVRNPSAIKSVGKADTLAYCFDLPARPAAKIL